MQEIENIHKRIEAFQKTIGDCKGLCLHKDNKFNKQMSVVLKDLAYIEIIIKRIESADPREATQLGLDLKSLYVFGRVFSESLIYIASLFIKSSPKIDWSKIGEFIKTSKKNLDSEPREFKIFWEKNKEPIEKLYETFRYRNRVLHEKNSNCEWTFAWPGRSNLDNVFISNVPWKEDLKTKEEETLNARKIIQTLYSESCLIIDYLESIYKAP
ncbi:MAG: hypothetical protein PHN94_13100 [Bacteroidales bacterium]|nr:hypothetical protein [Bacteroidales bacterium]MDD3940430.1 hypothetical protein [Candidatus Paceibacterota bacterium]